MSRLSLLRFATIKEHLGKINYYMKTLLSRWLWFSLLSAINHLSWHRRKQKCTSTGSKGHVHGLGFYFLHSIGCRRNWMTLGKNVPLVSWKQKEPINRGDIFARRLQIWLMAVKMQSLVNGFWTSEFARCWKAQKHAVVTILKCHKQIIIIIIIKKHFNGSAQSRRSTYIVHVMMYDC